MYNSIEKLKAFFPLETWENNEILRTKCEKIDIFDGDTQDFCDILMDLMYEYDWCGLAAPQIWKNIRAIATTQRKEQRKWNRINKKLIWDTVMINPEIIDHSDSMKLWEEWCLSIPWWCGDVERWSRIVVSYQDKKWKSHTQKYTWFSAAVVQHEMDHLEWILFTDKIVWKLRKFDQN